MAKQKNPRRVADNEARAKLRMIRISPQKLNLVAPAQSPMLKIIMVLMLIA